ILDTNSNPDGITFPVPGNDDAARALQLYCDLVADSVLDGLTEGQAAMGVDIGAAEAPVEPALRKSAAAAKPAPEPEPEPESPELAAATEELAAAQEPAAEAPAAEETVAEAAEEVAAEEPVAEAPAAEEVVAEAEAPAEEDAKA
ncbi:MAG TPA: 30S ribosomal protein S2, partial [Caulobacteraceae bacterium]|nr:30S ribosomal protein S2 [Caulobacteraceae bacterium]